MLETNKDDKTREIQQLDEWANKLGYNLGFWIGASLVGATAGLILGALAILKHSQNETIQRKTAVVSERARLDKISIPDLDRLARGEKLSDTNYRQAAIFIDRLEQLTGTFDRGRQLERDYIFYKSVAPNGAINYTVKDSKSARTLLDFDVDRDGNIAVQMTQGADTERQLMKFVNLAAERLSLDLNLLQDERERTIGLERDLASVEDSIRSIDSSVDLGRLATDSAAAQSQYIEELQQTNERLSGLKQQARVLQDLIRTAQNANAREQQRHPQTLHQIEVSHLAAKLIGLEQRIDSLSERLRQRLVSQLQSKPQTVDEVKTWQPAVPEPSLSSSEPESPANGQPITVLQTEAPALDLAEGIEQ